MQEYKRDRNALETRLTSAEKRAQYHDEHIRFIDGWFGEVRHLACVRCSNANLVPAA